jgi:uncharacterized repeat protein (TIGR04138 family)
MSLRDDLIGVLARDPRYPFPAYVFVVDALEFAQARKRKERARRRARKVAGATPSLHVTGRELCEGARDLAIEQYGLLAPLILGRWGIRSTSDLGEIVYNLIASGDLKRTPTDSRADFDDVFDFATAFRHDLVPPLDEVA